MNINNSVSTPQTNNYAGVNAHSLTAKASSIVEEHKRKTAFSLRDFLAALCNNASKPSLIAEVKKALSTKGVICTDLDAVKIVQAYERGGTSCISVLMDCKFFQGSFENLRKIGNSVRVPLLCKDFIIDLYLAQVHKADAVLLIAREWVRSLFGKFSAVSGVEIWV